MSMAVRGRKRTGGRSADRQEGRQAPHSRRHLMYVRNPLAPVVMSIPSPLPAPRRASEWMAVAGCSSGATRTLTDAVYDVTYREGRNQTGVRLGRGGRWQHHFAAATFVHPLAGWFRQRQRAIRHGCLGIDPREAAAHTVGRSLSISLHIVITGE